MVTDGISTLRVRWLSHSTVELIEEHIVSPDIVEGPFTLVARQGSRIVIARGESLQAITMDEDNRFHGSVFVPRERATSDWVEGRENEIRRASRSR